MRRRDGATDWGVSLAVAHEHIAAAEARESGRRAAD